VDRLTIKATSEKSAHEMLAALSEFHAELLESAEGFEITVALRNDGKKDTEIVAVLNALEQYVSARGRGPAQMELNGREFVMEPVPDSQ